MMVATLAGPSNGPQCGDSWLVAVAFRAFDEYRVVEAANTHEALTALGEPTLSVAVILCDVSALGSKSGFELASWVRTNRPELEVRLAGGVERAAETAAELCESGPHLSRPYEPEAVVNYIKRLRASRLS
jgi:CheY-like chemotaxis protein